jgi:hypothetical protein
MNDDKDIKALIVTYHDMIMEESLSSIDLEIPLFDDSFVRDFCGNSLRVRSVETYTDPENNYTVPKTVVFEALKDVNVKFRACRGIPFPGMSRIASWVPTRSYRPLKAKKGTVWTENIPREVYTYPLNMTVEC